jgi:N-methylhydantoinase A
MIARFHKEHQRRYGYHHAGREIEMVTLRLRVRLKQRKLQLKVARTDDRLETLRAVPTERAPVIYDNKIVLTPVFDRGQLVSGRPMRGPAVITEYSATTVIPVGKRFWVDEADNLVIKVR